PDMCTAGGLYLQNGSRFYVDCGLHPEMCTPECTSPRDAVRYIEAGHRILGSLASAVESAGGPGTEILCFRCNVDYSGSQSTWGCHESYLHRISQDELQPQIVPHLVSRLIYTGAGGFNPLSPGLEFMLSPRMAHFHRVVTENSTSERGIWHEKSDPLSADFSRLHVLCGESLCSNTAAYLKLGATALIVAMADAGLSPGTAVQLADPLAALHSVAADVSCKRKLRMADGRSLSAIEIQRRYLEQAESHLGAGFMPDWAPEVCRQWRAILNDLEDGLGSVEHTLDWAIKLALYANRARALGVRWEELPLLNQVIVQAAAVLGADKETGTASGLERAFAPGQAIPREIAEFEPVLQLRGLGWQDLRNLRGSRGKFLEIDTRFGQLGPKGIFETLDRAGVLNHRVAGIDNTDQAETEPPPTGRARIRGRVVQRLADVESVQCEWQCIVNYSQRQVLDLSDPFAQEELWSPLHPGDATDKRMSRRLGQLFNLEAGPGYAEGESPYARRQDAADRILSGDFAGAETLLRRLLEESFMLPSTRCHLARVLLMTDREPEAREHISQAWAIRGQASHYVVPRILFFQCVFAMFDGLDITSLVAQIDAALREPDPHMDWIVQPMIDHLRLRLGETNFQLLTALGKALSDASAMPGLDEFPQWRNAVNTGAVPA
ncbi:MAG: proteasome accessory factor PafA2 family protein, partial [Terracidiphilus sp.]